MFNLQQVETKVFLRTTAAKGTTNEPRKQRRQINQNVFILANQSGNQFSIEKQTKLNILL